jgi:hypothetical protein
VSRFRSASAAGAAGAEGAPGLPSPAVGCAEAGPYTPRVVTVPINRAAAVAHAASLARATAIDRITASASRMAAGVGTALSAAAAGMPGATRTGRRAAGRVSPLRAKRDWSNLRPRSSRPRTAPSLHPSSAAASARVRPCR